MTAMISPADLATIRTVITHADCPDGIASALICKDVLGARDGFEVRFMAYGTKELAEMPATPGMLFVDFCPPRERALSFLAAGAVVLDHHGTQRDVVEPFVANGLGVFADERDEPGVSGAVLAYRHVWEPIACALPASQDPRWVGEARLASDGPGTPEGQRLRLRTKVLRLASLAGVRDTWQKNSPVWDEACAQAEALRFWSAGQILEGGFASLEAKLAIGPVLIQKNKDRDAKSIREAYPFQVAGVRALAFEGWWTSDIADLVGDDTDLVIGWRYFVDAGTKKLVLSLRSRGAFDCAAMAKHYGGGGHKNAAGCVLALDDIERMVPDRSPYLTVSSLLARFLSDGE